MSRGLPTASDEPAELCADACTDIQSVPDTDSAAKQQPHSVANDACTVHFAHAHADDGALL